MMSALTEEDELPTKKMPVTALMKPAMTKHQNLMRSTRTPE